MSHHHTLVVTADNRPGVLQRVAGLVRRKNFRVVSLTTAATEDPTLVRLTVVVDGRQSAPRLVAESLYKLIDVRSVADLAEQPGISRELALLRVRAGSSTRAEVLQLAHLHGARVVEVSPRSLVLEMSGGSAEVNRLVALLRPFGIAAMTRTGALALPAASEEWEQEYLPAVAPAARPAPTAPGFLAPEATGFIAPLVAREGV